MLCIAQIWIFLLKFWTNDIISHEKRKLKQDGHFRENHISKLELNLAERKQVISP